MQENKTSTSTYRRFLQLKMITKYGIFGLAGFSLTYCFLTSLGYYVPWMFIAFFTFAFVLRLVLSKAFGLCFVHRSCILYNYCVSLCIVTKPETIQELFGVSNKKGGRFGVTTNYLLLLFSLSPPKKTSL